MLNNFRDDFKNGRFKQEIKFAYDKAGAGGKFNSGYCENFFCQIRLLMIGGYFVEADAGLRKYRHLLPRMQEYCKVEFRLLQAELDYQLGKSRISYRVARELVENYLFRTDQPRAEDNPLLKNFLGARIHHLAAKTLSRVGDETMARIHYGAAYSYALRSMKLRNLSGHFIAGRILHNVARSYLDELNAQDISQLLDLAEKHYDEYFGEAGKAHVYYADICYMRARNIAKHAEERKDWEKAAKSWVEKGRGICKKAEEVGLYNSRQINWLFIEAYIKTKKAGRLTEDRNSPYAGPEIEKCLLDGIGLHEKRIEVHRMMKKDYPGGKPYPRITRDYNFCSKAGRQLFYYYLVQCDYEKAKVQLKRVYEFLEEADLHNDPHSENDTDELGEKVIFRDDRQAFKTAKQRFLLNSLVHQLNQTDRQLLGAKSVSLSALKDNYGQCLKLMKRQFRFLSSQEGKKTMLHDFSKVQSAMIDVMYENYAATGGGEGKMKTINEVLNMTTHGYSYTDRLDIYRKKNKLTEIRRLQKCYVTLFFAQDPLSRPDGMRKEVFDAKIDEADTLSRNVINEHLQYLEKIKEEVNDKDELDVNNFTEMMERVPGAGIITYHLGKRHLYCITVFGGKDGLPSERSEFYRLTSDADESNRKLFMSKIKGLNKLLNTIIQTTKLDRDECPVKRTTFQYETWANKAPRASVLNSRLIKLLQQVYQLMLGGIKLSPDDERLYIVVTDEELQRLNFSMLCSSPLLSESRRGELVSFSDFSYLGSERQVCTTASLFEIEEWNDRDKEREDWRDNALSLIAAHKSKRSKADATHLANFMAGTFAKISQYVNHYFRSNRNIVKLPTGAEEPYSTEIKGQMLDLMPTTDFLITFSHVGLESPLKDESFRGTYLRNCIEIKLAPEKVGGKQNNKPSTWIDALQKVDNKIYIEEIEERDLRHLKLVLVLGCEAGSGPGQIGYSAHSIMSAFVRAKAWCAIGSQYQVTNGALDAFFTKFCQHLTRTDGETKPQVGYCFQQTIIDLLKEGKKSSAAVGSKATISEDYSHPIMWGTFLVNGDLTISSKDILGDSH